MNQDWRKVYLDWNILGSGNDKRKLQNKVQKCKKDFFRVQKVVIHLDELARISEVYLDKKHYFYQKIRVLRVKVEVK